MLLKMSIKKILLFAIFVLLLFQSHAFSGSDDSESLKNTFERVVPYYKKKIEPLITSKKNILIVAHGNSLRALCKKIFNISKEKIIDFEIPTGNPLLITFNKYLEVNKYKYLDSKRSKNILFNV